MVTRAEEIIHPGHVRYDAAHRLRTYSITLSTFSGGVS